MDEAFHAPSAFFIRSPSGFEWFGLRFAPVGAKRASTGRTAPSRGRSDLIFPDSRRLRKVRSRLPMDECTLREMMAQGGYDVAVDVKFTVAEIGEMQHMVMKGMSKKEIQTTPKNDDDFNPMIQLLILGFYGGM